MGGTVWWGVGTVIRFHLLWYLYSDAFFFFPVLHFVSSLSSSFFQGGDYFEVMLLTIFSSHSSSFSLASDAGAPWYSHCARLSEIFILRFLAFTVTLWIPYGRVGYEKFRKMG